MKKNKLSIYLVNSNKIDIASQKKKKYNSIVVNKLTTKNYMNSNFYKPITKLINLDDF